MKTIGTKSKSLFMLFFLGIAAFLGGQISAQAAAIDLEQAKLVKKFGDSGRWTAESKDSKFIIGVFDDKNKFDAFTKFFENKKVQNKVTVVRLVENVRDARNVNIIYVPAEQNKKLTAEKKTFNSLSTLAIREVTDKLYNVSFKQKQRYIVFTVDHAEVFDKNLTIAQLMFFLNDNSEELFAEDADEEEAERQTLSAINQRQTKELIDITAKQKKEIAALKKQLKTEKSAVSKLNKKLSLNQESAKNRDAGLQKESERLKIAYQENAKNLKNIEAKEKELQALKAETQTQQDEIAKQKKLASDASEKLATMAKSKAEPGNFQLLFFVFVGISVIALLIALMMWKKAKAAASQPAIENNDESKELLSVREQQLIKAENFSALGYIASDTTYAVGTYLEDLQAQLESSGDNKNVATLKPIVTLLENFNQIAADQDDNTLQQFDIVEYAAKMSQMYDIEFNQSDINYVYSGEKALQVKSVPSYIALVLLHLMNNAIKHGFDNNGNGKISLKLEKSGKDGAKMTFSDDGKGMDKATLDKVFEPFFTTRSDRGYTGVGMTTTHALVTKKLKGDIKIDSKKGAGTTVTITLP